MAEGNLFLDGGLGINVNVHPVVLFSIVDHYSRRNEGQTSVIGSLLGNFDADGRLCEITNCYPVPHTETDPVAIDMDFHRSFADLLAKSSTSGENLVGFYTTGAELGDHVRLFNDFYRREMEAKQISFSPVILTVDTSLQNNRLATKAYTSQNLSLSGGSMPMAALFEEIQVAITPFEAEKTAVDFFIRGLKNSEGNKVSGDSAVVESALRKLLARIDTVVKYVTDVTSGEKVGNAEIGRALVEAVNTLPKVEMEAYEQMFQDSLQDMLMVVYLAQLTRTQITISEKLQQNP